MERDTGPLVVKLPRTPGRMDSEYMHLFSGPVDVEAHVSQARESQPARSGDRIVELEERVRQLETEVAALKDKLG